MGELTHLAEEMTHHPHVDCEAGRAENLVKFRVTRGQYDNISSEVMSIIGRYDVSMSHVDDGEWNYYLIP